MSLRRIKASNTTLYIIAILVIVVVFLILGGSEWVSGLNTHRSMGISHFCWTQIIISLIIGFVLGWFVCKKRR